MNEGTVFKRTEGSLARITFFHPKGNSLPSALLNSLVDLFEMLGQDDSVRVILLQSEGNGSFCGGASFDELLAVSDLEQARTFFSGFAHLINAMRKCPKPIIGRIQGKAVGGGVGIIAAADYCFATEAADVKLSELSIGIGPFVIAPAVERKAGIAALSELTLDAKTWKTAYWAQKKGLYQRVYENTRDMDEGIGILADQLEQYSPQALAEMKQVFWEGTEHWDELLVERAEKSGRLALSDFTKKALEAFKKDRQ
jgi:methylglutaconyl-CoA hydratase